MDQTLWSLLRVDTSFSNVFFADCRFVFNTMITIPLSGVVMMYAILLLVTTLLLLSVAPPTSRNLSELGLRPHGKNLWEWWWSYNVNAKNGASGIPGYDPILGSFDPSSRSAFHVAAMLGTWGFILQMASRFVDEGNSDIHQGPSMHVCEDFLRDVVPSGLFAISLYSFVVGFSIHYLLPGVSRPGGPRPHKIRRNPKWVDGRIALSKDILKGWTFLTAEESHEATSKQFDSELLLTGESAGRQTWFKLEQQDNKNEGEGERDQNVNANNQKGVGSLISSFLLSPSKNSKPTSNADHLVVDESLVQSLALGGRDKPGFEPSVNPNTNDQIFRSQQIRKYLRKFNEKSEKVKDENYAELSPPPNLAFSPKTVKEACRKAAQFYNMLLCDDGHWAGDYGGPHFLLPGLVVTWYVMNRPSKLIDEHQARMMTHYIRVHQQVDGGWGSHIESPSTMFGSVLMYVALRLLGSDKNDKACVKARVFLDKHGGALYTSSWSKFYLCLLGVMDWKGHNSVPPEMWLLPNWVPFHPGRMWCHARMVYLPMGYLYGSRFVYANAETDSLVAELRKELYADQSYDSIPWTKTRQLIAETDNYSPIPLVMRILQNVLARYENWFIFDWFRTHFRQHGLNFSMEYMKAEDLQTNFIDIGPVNKVLNMLSMYHHHNKKGGDDESDDSERLIERHMARVRDYLWLAEDGMKMQGYNGSQCWDTSFATQAFFEAELLDEFPDLTRKVWSYFEKSQILSTRTSKSSPAYLFESNDNRYKFYRHISEGGWPFSTSAHGWPISDCTGEGLKSTLCLLKTKTIQDALKYGKRGSDAIVRISDERLYKAANILLTYQNEDGGWATYENNRGWGWYEQLNPSEVFGDIMIDYSYVECSMASLTALVDFAELFPDHRTDDIQRSIDKGRAFLRDIQRDDGSWYGSWACCFSYGIWFGIEGLIKSGEPVNSPCIIKACQYLLKYQHPNGGWGEDFTSCYDKDYAKDGMKAYGDSEGSGVVNTAWALMALSYAKYEDVKAIRKGVQYLMKRQLPSGDWPQEGISGVFNRSIGITYTAYRNVFPLWALGRCREIYGEEALADEANSSHVLK